ncbi:MAG: hypothetical protein BMS9Abin10_0155 [Gammaproteobacteria bacterium]|nr:MAG: hypothetical protein BMS9Abin10_0155 [Gammaproteobacteria bacterium]
MCGASMHRSGRPSKSVFKRPANVSVTPCNGVHASYIGVCLLLVILMTEFATVWSAGMHASECSEIVGEHAQPNLPAAA